MPPESVRPGHSELVKNEGEDDVSRSQVCQSRWKLDLRLSVFACQTSVDRGFIFQTSSPICAGASSSLPSSVTAMACSLCRLPFAPKDATSWPLPGMLSSDQINYMKRVVAMGPYVPGVVATLVFSREFEHLSPSSRSLLIFVAQRTTCSWEITLTAPVL